MINGDTIYCDCCGREKVAEIKEDKVIIKVRRHGDTHVAVIPVKEILDKALKNGYAFNNGILCKA